MAELASALPTLRLPALAASASRRRLRAPAPGAVIVAASAGSYAALAWLFAIGLGVAQGDAYSRFANAYYVFFSRDPHLAAVGFVWTPLPSLVEMLALPLQLITPGMLVSGIATGAMSTFFMTAAVWVMWLLLGDLGLGAWSRAILTAAFAFNPMAVYYAALGTSEAPMLFSLLLTVLALQRWLSGRGLRWLAYAGLALALAFLNRYEAIVAATGAAVLVAFVTFARDHRWSAVTADLTVLLLPLATTFVFWSVTSWIITGDAFTQFSSTYGNSSQMRIWTMEGANETADPSNLKILRLFLRTSGLQLTWLPAGLAAAWLLLRRRDLRSLPSVAVMVPVVGFMGVEYVTGALAPWLRYFVAVIPLGIVLCGVALSPRRPASPRRGGALKRLPAAAGRLGLVVVALASIPVCALALLSPVVGHEESRDLGSLLAGERCGSGRTEVGAVRCFTTEREIARYLDSLDLRDGSVIVDTFSAFPVVVASRHPRQFVITSDRDFHSDLVDPAGSRVQFLLVPPNQDHGTLDAVNQAYPRLYQDGAGVATLAMEFPGKDDSSTWRLYRVLSKQG